MPRTYFLPDRFERFIDNQVADGRYASPTEVVQAGLEALEEMQTDNTARIEEIKAVIEAGRMRGQTVPAADVFRRVESQIRDKLRGA